MRSKKRPKIKCEICGCLDAKVLEYHHIIPRTDINCTHSNFNLAILCPTCHAKHHAGLIKIIGAFPSTDPTGFSLVYELDGIKNVDIDEPYCSTKPESVKVHGRS